MKQGSTGKWRLPAGIAPNRFKTGNPMKNRSPFIALASVLFLLMVCGPLDAYGAGRIDVILDRGVSREAEAQTRLALDATIEFFKKTYGLALERNLEIFVVPDKKAHINALKQRYRLTESEASHSAENTAGSARGGVIVVNVGNTSSNQDYIFALCHEMVHYFQSQESYDFRTGSIIWLTEGAADALAAQIMAAAGGKSADLQNRWPEILRRAQRTPKLEQLHSPRDWSAAINAYSSVVAYKTSAVAVLTLIQAKGNKPLFTYFRALRNTNPEDAFYQAFGIRLSDFEKQFRPF